MADSILPAALQEIQAAYDALSQHITGAQGFRAMPALASLQGPLDDLLAKENQMLAYLKTVLQAGAALQAEGYPNLPKFQLPQSQMDLLMEQLKAMEVAEGDFSAQPQAASAEVAFTDPLPKP